MATNLVKYRADLTKLIELGVSMLEDVGFQSELKKRELTDEEMLAEKRVHGSFRSNYQQWYTEAFAIISQIIPDRRTEFEVLYKGDGKRRTVDVTNFNIQDWLNGMQFTSSSVNGFDAAAMRFITQLEILKAVERRFESSLFDLKQTTQAELFDSEIDAARELVKSGFLRGAGAIAGVVLERHLAQIASNHRVTIRKKHPTISELNDLLKNADVIETSVWRSIQYLGDIRNLCDHDKGREPNSDEVLELINGVDKCVKTLF